MLSNKCTTTFCGLVLLFCFSEHFYSYFYQKIIFAYKPHKHTPWIDVYTANKIICVPLLNAYVANYMAAHKNHSHNMHEKKTGRQRHWEKSQTTTTKKKSRRHNSYRVEFFIQWLFLSFALCCLMLCWCGRAAFAHKSTCWLFFP